MSPQLDFARWCCRWSAKDWEYICWIDESTFEIGKNSRQVHVWRTTYRQYSSSCVFPLLWFEVVLQEIRNHSLFSCQRIDSKDIDFVKLVYDGQLLQFMGKVSCAILMKDGALVHWNKVLEEWRKLHLIEKLERPANSPHLNPLENIWKLLKDAVQHSQSYSKTLEECKHSKL
jgi:hypothetical protein